MDLDLRLAELSGKLDEALALLRAALPKPIASDADMAGPYGDPIIKMKDPRDWTGETCVGKRLSECPAAYLDMVADRADFFAKKNDETGAKDDKGRPKSYWDRKAAALARGWARRNRTTPPVGAPEREPEPFL
jgi:hypothetical protein